MEFGRKRFYSAYKRSFISKERIFFDYKNDKFIKNDTILYADLMADSLTDKGCIMNVKPPYYIWKEAKNDTLKVFKHNVTLKFTKRKVY